MSNQESFPDCSICYFVLLIMFEYIEEAKYIAKCITDTWPNHFDVVVKEPHGVPLRELFLEPKNRGLKHIWKYGSADIVVYKNNKLVCIIEPGGSHHFQDETQMKNDRRKWKLCNLNGVPCLRIANGVLNKLSNRKRRNLLGRFCFGMKDR